MSFLSGKKLLLLGFVIVLLVVIPLTVYLVQQQQKLRVGAAPQTILSFNPASTSTTSGQTFPLDVSLNPGGNQVSFVKLTIQYDPTKLATSGAGLVANTAVFPSVLQGPTYTNNTASITLSVGSSSQSVISTLQPKIATITFKALSVTSSSSTSVSFVTDTTQNSPTQVLSIASSDQFNENVLATAQPANITIGPSITTSPSPGGSTSTTTNALTCTSLLLDKSSTGTAPYTLNFTAAGTTTAGTISKVTFAWGDGSQNDVTTGGGIGTASVNVSLVHTYSNAGSFTAKATLTDSSGNVSQATNACSQTVTINQASGSTGGTGATPCPSGSTCQTVTIATPTPTATPSPSVSPTPLASPPPRPSLAPTGPGDSLVSFGALGIISIVVGALLLFGL